MIGSAKTILHALPLLAAFAGTANAAPRFQFPLAPGGHEPHQIDLSKYTIGQILNYTLHHRGPHDGEDHRHGEDGDEHRHPRGPPLFKLAYVVNRTESIKAYLSDPDISVTLFAPDDEALRPPPGHGPPPHHGPPHHGRPGDHDHDRKLFDSPFGNDDDEQDSVAPRYHPFHLMTDDDEHHKEPSDEEKRRFIHKIIEAVLHYHISPSELSADELKDKQTIPTTLNQTKDASVPFRIRAGSKLNFFPPPPTYDVKLNFYAGLRKIPSIKAKNGIIHLISAPLLPPLTPLDQLLAFPLPFSTLTSAIQQTELDSALAPWLHHHEHKEGLMALAKSMGFKNKEETGTVMSVLKELVDEAIGTQDLPKAGDFAAFPFTIFAPTNVAFAKIPFRIRTFLFSPFGRPFLKKLLSFHVVPQYILHTDYHLNASRKASGSVAPASTETVPLPTDFLHMPEPASLGDVEEENVSWELPDLRRGGDDKAEVERHVLPTVLGNEKNQTLHVNVYTYRSGFGKGPLEKAVSVGNSEQNEDEYTKVWVRDGVAWGGAVHVINSLIRPVLPHHHGDGPGHDGPPHHRPGHDGPPHHGPGRDGPPHRGPHHEEMAQYFGSLWA